MFHLHFARQLQCTTKECKEKWKKITAKNDINKSVRLVLNVSKIFSQEEEQGV